MVCCDDENWLLKTLPHRVNSEYKLKLEFSTSAEVSNDELRTALRTFIPSTSTCIIKHTYRAEKENAENIVLDISAPYSCVDTKVWNAGKLFISIQSLPNLLHHEEKMFFNDPRHYLAA